MEELAIIYKTSLKELNVRINELNAVRNELISASKDPRKDSGVIELDERLKPLRIMQEELVEVTKEVEHYYDKGWWRSEKYTFNVRKPRKFIYCEPIYCEGSNEF